MKKISLIILLSVFTPLAFAYLPLPSPQQGGSIIASMRAQNELEKQNIEIEMMHEQLAMMQQQRAMMEMQIRQQEKARKKVN